MRPQHDRLRADHACAPKPHQIPILLLGPHLDHLSRVVLVVTLSKPKLAGNVPFGVW